MIVFFKVTALRLMHLMAKFWMAFSGGATLVVGTPEMMQSGADLKLTINELGITIFRYYTNLTIMGASSVIVAIVIVGGEQCTAPVVEKWQLVEDFSYVWSN